MRKIFSIVLCLEMLAFGTSAFAGDYETINDKVESMTDLQKDIYVESLIGTTFNDCGKVVDVTDYFIMIDKSTIFPAFHRRYVYIFNVPREIAILINKEEKLCFRGTITEVKYFPDPDVNIDYISSDKDTQIKPSKKVEDEIKRTEPTNQNNKL